MQTHSINIPVSLQKLFSIIPENAVLFGGAIRDLIRGKDKVNNLDLLFKDEKSINDFYTDLVFKTDINAKIEIIQTFDECNITSNDDINVDIKRIKFIAGGNEYQIDCVLSKNPTDGFLSDYDVNALYGVVKDNKVEIVGNIIKYNDNYTIIKIIDRIKESKVAVGYFKKNTSQRIIDWRKSKIKKHGFFANFNNPEENDSKFVSANEILAQASEFFKNKMNKKEQEILDKNDPESSYNYCLDNKEANISLHEDIICKSNNSNYIYNFARDIKGANIEKLEEAIIKTNDIYHIYLFAKYVKEADLDKFKDILENLENKKYKEDFKVLYKEYKKNKMSKKEQEILAKNNACASYDYCIKNEDANISLHEEIIIKENDIDYIYLFAKYVKRANLEKFKNILENSKYKKEFANFYENYKYNSSSNLSESKESPKAVKETKEEKKMTNTGFDIEFFTKNFAEGAYAGAANEVVNNLAKSLIFAIKASGMDEGSVKIIEDGMNSQLGKICLAMMVGTGIKFIPVNLLQENKSLQKIAEKCVENAGSQGTQFALNGAMNILLPALLGAIQDNPQLKLAEQVGALTAPTKARVESNPKDLADDLSEEEANAFNEEFTKKKAKSGLNK